MDELGWPDRQLFDQRIQELASKKSASYNQYLSEEQYNKYLEEVRAAKLSRKTTKDRRRIHRFDIATISGQDKLIAPMNHPDDPIKFFAKTTELYDILYEAHDAVGHGGRNRMLPICQEKYANVGVDPIMVFLRLCGICLGKKKKKGRGLCVKPMVFSELNDRGQVDLIDYQTTPDGPYKFIFVYQDHLTKFVHLRALQRKTMFEVAEKLVEIWLVFGAPSVLQSDNGREFANHVIQSLSTIWPDLKIVHGKPLTHSLPSSLLRNGI